MKSRRPKLFKRPPVLKELKELYKTDKDNSWFLFHYGKTFFNSNKNKLFRECYFKSIQKKHSYYIKGWDINSEIVKITIPETSVFYYPLGSVFNNKGKFLKAVSEPQKGKCYELKNVKLSSKEHYRNKGFKSILEGSYYPLLDQGEESVYTDFPYYYTENQYHGNKKVIIPIQVITSYFFYFSPICIYNILMQDVHVGIKRPIYDNSPPVLPYRSNVIREEELRKLGKYFFSSTRKYSEDCLKAISNRLRKAMINSKKVHGEFGKHYIKSAIPFNLDCYFDFLGFYIDDIGAEESRFIVMRINDVRVSKKNSFFKFENFDILDLTDKRSAANRDSKEEKGYTAVAPDYSGFSNDFNQEEDVNSNFEILDKVQSNRSQFLKSPDISKLDKTDQEKKYILERLIIKPVIGIGDNYGNQSSDSLYQSYNEVGQISLNDFFEVTIAAMNVMKERGATVQALKLKDNDGVFSYAPIENEFYDRLLIFQICVQGYNYCLLDAGYGKMMGLFRYVDHEIGFKEYGDERLTVLIIDLIEEENFNFTSVRKIQKYNGFYFLEPFRHLEKKFRNSSIQAKAHNLALRLINKINKDV